MSLLSQDAVSSNGIHLEGKNTMKEKKAARASVGNSEMRQLLSRERGIYISL